MAVSDITATVLRITGVSPTANSVEDGQRFVVSSVPKDLLMFAQKVSSASTDGSAISFSVQFILLLLQMGAMLDTYFM